MPEPLFTPVDSRVAFPRLEEETLAFWQQQDIFRKSVANRAGAPQYTFYEGPPTANGAPGIHHVLARVFKDVVLRYQTMRGNWVPRRGGWDTHGLPVELEVERKLGFTGKKDIEAFGIAEFNRLCRESVFTYVQAWERMTERIAFWVDMDDAYVTYSNDYIESCWWIIHRLWEQDLVFQDYKVTPHCPRCGTSLSSHEVALGYKDGTDDPSVYVRLVVEPNQPAAPSALGLADGVPTAFLAWTTTPWTLPGNVAIALAPDADYALVERDNGGVTERLLLADGLRDRVLRGDHRVISSFRGSELAGLRYRPLYDQHPDKPAYRSVTDSFVTLDDGTGVVHIAPAFGETDLALGRREGLPVLVTVDLRGLVAEGLPGAGEFVKQADPRITRDLDQRGLLFRAERIKHTYPFCWRCDTPLLYYAKTSWYLKTTAIKEQLLAGNEAINWFPDHIKAGRFGDWLANNVDWAVSRERYWGTPLNIWRSDDGLSYECFPSRAALAARAGRSDLLDDLDLHRPYIDEITFPAANGSTMRRVPEVLDAWFDSGAMPYGQQHYPFAVASVSDRRQDPLDVMGHAAAADLPPVNVIVQDVAPVALPSDYPADFICEAVDQTRGWFYSLHAISELLFGQPAYRNVICLGHILDAKGEKMSKSRGNVVDPWSVIDVHGVDAIRWYMYAATPAGQPRRFSADLVGEVVRKFLLTLWNTYSFFVLYANLDGWQPAGRSASLEATTPLDRWILAELHQLVTGVTAAMDAYDPTSATRQIQAFVDDLSNWYIRRNRRRFWKSEGDADKSAAYATLHECLATVSRLMAPFAPFASEALYQNLVRRADPAVPESVHMADWPMADASLIDEPLMSANRLAMRVVALGRAARSKANLKVRQPLAAVRIRVRNAAEVRQLEHFSDVVMDELNVLQVEFIDDESALLTYQLKPNLKTLGPRLGADLTRVRQLITSASPADAGRLVDHFRTESTISLTATGFLFTPLPSGDAAAGSAVVLERDDILVETSDAPGLSAVAESGYAVAVTTDLSDELLAMGHAREIAHRIQQLRKTAGLAVSDRITTWIDAPLSLHPALESQRHYIESETLTTHLSLASPPPATLAVDGFALPGVEKPVTIGLQPSPAPAFAKPVANDGGA